MISLLSHEKPPDNQKTVIWLLHRTSVKRERWISLLKPWKDYKDPSGSVLTAADIGQCRHLRHWSRTGWTPRMDNNIIHSSPAALSQHRIYISTPSQSLNAHKTRFAHLNDSVLLIRGRQGGGGGEIYNSGSSETIISALLSDTERSYLGKIKKSTSRSPLKSFFVTLWPNPENEALTPADPRMLQLLPWDLWSRWVTIPIKHPMFSVNLSKGADSSQCREDRWALADVGSLPKKARYW